MARKVRNSKLDSRSARLRLDARREPYWQKISPGCYIGYRRIANGGSWIARMRDEAGRQHYEALGAADDNRDADGIAIYNFEQAQGEARAYFDRLSRQLAGHEEECATGPYTVKIAIDDYFAHRRRSGSKGVDGDVYAANARIIPDLGEIQIGKLTARRIERWLDGLAAAPRLLRTKKISSKRVTRAVDEKDPEEVRKRRATANRVLTVLKASLNYAFARGRATNDEAWRRVRPFREVDAARVRYLREDECRRLFNACDGTFRHLVCAALLTGCRYGELVRMAVSDFDAGAATVTVRLSKAGKPRHVALTDEGKALFVSMTSGKSGREIIFMRDDGNPWGASHQQRPLISASARAGIDPPASSHILRHTYATTLAMRGAPMGVIAAQLGHSDTRMTERHYAHLSPSYVAETVRASLPTLGIVEESNIIPFSATLKA